MCLSPNALGAALSASCVNIPELWNLYTSTISLQVDSFCFIGVLPIMKRPMDSISTRLKTSDTPTLGDEWERLERDYGIDGAAFIRFFVQQVVAFERKHGRPPKLANLAISERE